MPNPAEDFIDEEDDFEPIDAAVLGPDGGPLATTVNLPARTDLDDDLYEADADEGADFEAAAAAPPAPPMPDPEGPPAAAAPGEDEPRPADLGGDDRPVPRISIQAFCERPETSALLEQAAGDRRLAKAHVTIQMGGIPAAAEHFQETPTPNLILVETLGAGAEIFGHLEALAHVCDPSTRVIVIGSVNDITLYRELIRQGVSEYLVSPRSPLQVIHAIASLYVDPSAPPIGRTMAFFGARGGVGSSTLAHNIAWCIAEDLKSETTIVDLDLSFGTAGLDFNQDPGQGVAEALASPERLDDVLLDRLLTKCGDRLNLFAAPSTLDRDYEHDAGAYETVVDVVRSAVPMVVLDLPHQWTAWTKRLLMTADQVVLSATADLASLRNAKNMYDLITAARPNDPAPILVLNQVGAPKRPEIPAKDFAEAVGLEPSLILPWDPQLFGTAANNAMTVVEVNARHKASEGLRRLARQISGREVNGGKGGSFLSRLLGKA